MMDDFIFDGFKGCSDKELEEMAKTGVIYTPYTPLQVTKIDMEQRAKTPEQKREIIDRLYDAWVSKPELRLGQLIVNQMACPRDDLTRQLFYLEDKDLIEVIEHETNR
jgi:hypothetical protein